MDFGPPAAKPCCRREGWHEAGLIKARTKARAGPTAPNWNICTAMTQPEARHDCDVAIIGAGPYGLSLAAHLAAAGVNFRIFGRPMGLWREHMPQNMMLKSNG